MPAAFALATPSLALPAQVRLELGAAYVTEFEEQLH
jgi:hypothetical protein